MPGWQTGRMINTAQNAPAVNNVAGALANRGQTPYTAGQATTPVGRVGTQSVRPPVATPNPNPNFGSGVTLPTPHPSSVAITDFVNNPTNHPGTPTQPIDPLAGHGTINDTAPPPAAPTPNYAAPPPGRNLSSDQILRSVPTGFEVLAQGLPGDVFNPHAGGGTPAPSYDAYVKAMNDAQTYARGQGATEQQVNDFLGRMNYMGVNNYGTQTGDPAQAWAQYQAQAAQAAQNATAQAAAGVGWGPAQTAPAPAAPAPVIQPTMRTPPRSTSV